jgi:hypothetical protein
VRHVYALLLLFSVSIALAQSPDHLSDAEIAAAIAARPDTGFVNIEEMGFTTPSLCKAQMPSEAIFTPAGWLNAQSINAKKQYLPFHPTPDDTLRVLTVVSKGCANGTAAALSATQSAG